jgi:hypothetical protein
MFVGDNPRQCESCHDLDSEIGGIVTEIHQSLVEADEAIEAAESAVKRAAALGMIVSDEEVLLDESFTRLVTARAAQHTVDLDLVRVETDAAMELSVAARQQAETAIGENENRRQAMVIVLAVIGLIIVSLVLLRRELIASRARSQARRD